MFRLLRWAFWMFALAVMLWFAATVPLGRRTLVQHVRAIAGTPEAQSLAEGTRDEAAKVADRVRQELVPEPDSGSAKPAEKGTPHGGTPGSAPPSDQLDQRDRDALDRMVRDRTGGTTAGSRPGPAR